MLRMFLHSDSKPHNAVQTTTSSKAPHRYSPNRTRIVPAVITVAVAAVLISPGFSSVQSSGPPNQPQLPKLTPAQQARLQGARAISVHIRKVAKLLKAEGVEIEPQLLFTSNGRKKLRPQLLGIPEMYLSKTSPGRLRGVVMADTLTLPEKVKIDGDTVIIARRINFTGRAPTIKGSHDLHLFALDSANVANGRETVVTIDTSGFGNKEWLESLNHQASSSKQIKTMAHHANLLQNTSGTPGSDGIMGAVGSNGINGAHGAAGVGGSCSTNKNGANGGAGDNGSDGGEGGLGSDGAAGNSATAQTINIPNVNAGSYNIIAKGGKGGNGGPGGFGGTGGAGGNGGAGGDGAGCNCQPGGLGNGGNGGAAGGGGKGGNGGKGGKGGNGGAGASVVIYYPWGYNITQVTVDAQGGSAGEGGIGGSSAAGGSAGSRGPGGHGGSVFGCDPARNGSAGTQTSGGAGGSGGMGGSSGQSGPGGSVSWNPTTGPESSGGGDTYGYEPGLPEEYCTPWYLVSFHCDYYIDQVLPTKKKQWANHALPVLPRLFGWQCVETGRIPIGCF